MYITEYLKIMWPVNITALILLWLTYKAAFWLHANLKDIKMLMIIKNRGFYTAFIKGFLLYLLFLSVFGAFLLSVFLSCHTFLHGDLSISKPGKISIKAMNDGYDLSFKRAGLFLSKEEMDGLIILKGIRVLPPFNIFQSEGAYFLHGIGIIRRRDTRVFTSEDIYRGPDHIMRLYNYFDPGLFKYIGYKTENIRSPSFHIKEGDFQYKPTRKGIILIGL